MIPTKAEKEKSKLIQEKSQQYLSELLKDEDNKYCVDCDAKGPRWASWNLGIFLCIRCAGIHRNMGVHISKVKSVNLDSWSPAQVACMQRMGNSKARAVYEANLPDNFKRPQADSGLEAFVRAKYENKKYIAKEWVQPPTPPPAFDIDEERKKEKEKKKTKIIKSQASSSIIELTNPVPRPHSSPAGTVINAEKVLVNKNASNNIKLPSSDLLGLSTTVVTKNNTANILNDDDQFDAFVSCPISSKNLNEELATIPESKPIPSKTSEEEDFFNQKAPEEKKLDKESILKLYESSNIIQSHNNLFNLNSTIQPLNLNTNTLANNFTSLSSNPLQPTPVTNSFSSNNLNQAGNLENLFASNNNPINNCVNGNFANFSNQNIQPANFTTQQPPFFNSTSINSTTNSTTSSTNPFLTTVVNDTSTIQSNDLFSSISTNNLKNLDSQLNNLNLNPVSNSITSINWPNTSNNFNSNFNSTGQSLFSANFDSDKKIDSNFNTTVLKETMPSVNPFLSADTKNNLNDFDILSSISIQKPTNVNGISKINGNSEVIDNSNTNWSTLHTNNTNNNLATADLWQ